MQREINNNYLDKLSGSTRFLPALFAGILLLSVTVLAVKGFFNRASIIENSVDAEALRVAGSLEAHDKDSYLKKLDWNRRNEVQASINYISHLVYSHLKDPFYAKRLAEVIVLESAKNNIDPFFIAAIIKAESTFNSKAISNRGARGLMQLLPSTGEHISKIKSITWGGTSSLSDPSYNLRLGILYFKHLQSEFKGNSHHALVAYNWGPGNLYKAFKGEANIPSSSLKYSEKIQKLASFWKSECYSKISKYRFASLSTSTQSFAG